VLFGPAVNYLLFKEERLLKKMFDCLVDSIKKPHLLYGNTTDFESLNAMIQST